jgi:hypothetical protein
MCLAAGVEAKYSGGTGEPNEPYQIGKVADLLTLAADTNDYNKCFVLTADIDLGSYGFTTAVIARDVSNANYYFDGIAFSGLFDGAGKKVVNLTINTHGVANGYLGLFGQIDGGEIKNLRLQSVLITGGDYSQDLGGLVAENMGGTIDNCSSTGTVTGWYGSNEIGGLVGDNWGGTINNCSSTGVVSGTDSSYYIGGLVGWNDHGNISNCFATGTVTGDSDSYALGGLAGYNQNGNISNCSSSDAVTGGAGSSNMGGLAGENEGTISSCLSTGTVNGDNDSSSLGGLAGVNYNIISDCYSTGAVTYGSDWWDIGGLVGYNNGNINSSYSTGAVAGQDEASDIGGLAGESDGNIISSYFLVTNGPDNGYGTPLADAKMKQQSSFVGWDFVGETVNGRYDIWRLCNEDLQYPKLVWEYLPGDIVCPDGVDILDIATLCDQWLFEEIQADLLPPGGDGIVDFADFAVLANQWPLTQDISAILDFAEQWLKVGLPNCSADIWPLPNGDGQVNASDLAVMCNNWLQ